jgi:dTDP-4-dehydrorhamnose reductase
MDVIADVQPNIVINAAAFTDVDRAEAEQELAARVNCDAPAAMAAACERLGAVLVHLSTDYVFDGSKPGAYVEGDPVAPLSVYGRTKADGETAVRRIVQRHVILRTSWVFAAHGRNFVRTMLRLADEHPELRIVNDQTGSPTAARDVAEAVVSVVRAVAEGKSAWGTYHFASAEPTTWYGFARAIFSASGHRTKLAPVTSAKYQTAARRPLNSVLNCGRISRDYGIGQPSWRKALAEVLTELRSTAKNSDVAAS